MFQLGENDYSIRLVNGSTVDEASKNIPRIVNAIISGVEVITTIYTPSAKTCYVYLNMHTNGSINSLKLYSTQVA